jgi:hypothetical protein
MGLKKLAGKVISKSFEEASKAAGAIGDAAGTVKDVTEAVVDKGVDVAKGAGGAVVGGVVGAAGAVVDGAKGAVDAVTGGVKGATDKTAEKVDDAKKSASGFSLIDLFSPGGTPQTDAAEKKPEAEKKSASKKRAAPKKDS